MTTDQSKNNLVAIIVKDKNRSDAIREMLRYHGYTFVRQYNDMKTAKIELERDTPKLIIMDFSYLAGETTDIEWFNEVIKIPDNGINFILLSYFSTSYMLKVVENITEKAVMVNMLSIDKEEFLDIINILAC